MGKQTNMDKQTKLDGNTIQQLFDTSHIIYRRHQHPDSTTYTYPKATGRHRVHKQIRILIAGVVIWQPPKDILVLPGNYPFADTAMFKTAQSDIPIIQSLSKSISRCYTKQFLTDIKQTGHARFYRKYFAKAFWMR